MSAAVRPRGHTATMSHRAVTPPGDLNFFPTPPWAGRAGAELVKRLDPGACSAWEPACGQGHMAEPLADYFDRVWASDVFGYGYGSVLDFLSAEADRAAGMSPDWIITNPPFDHIEAFITLALRRARRGVAMLMRTTVREGQGRYRRLWSTHPVSVIAPFADRVPMFKHRFDPAGSTAAAYGWFVWLKPETGSPLIDLAEAARRLTGEPSAAVEMIIPPGVRERLTLRRDLERFRGRG